MGIRYKRIFAFLIDWNITVLPFLLAFGLIVGFASSENGITPMLILLCFGLMIFAVVLLVLRDFLLKGRSLGKRLFGLCVYDKKTMEESRPVQCFLRNILFFLYPVDGILLLCTGESLGDRVAGTVVLSQESLDNYRAERTTADRLPMPKEKNDKNAIKMVLILAVCLLVFLGLIMTGLNAQKDTEEYKLAYNYLVASDAFEELDVAASRIWMNRYALTTEEMENGVPVRQSVEIGFKVGFKSFTVVCHKENGVWQVCDECTLFE